MTPDIRPLTADLMTAMGLALKGSWGSSCWCMHPRLRDAEMKALPGDGPLGPRRKQAMAALAGGPVAPGLLAFDGDTPVGWVAVGPRPDYHRVDRSKATPRVDDVDVWIIPCITVAKPARGQGVAVRLLEAAADFAFANGAPAVEAYPRADGPRASDDSAYFGTETIFRRAGFDVIRGHLDTAPKSWTKRVTVRKHP